MPNPDDVASPTQSIQSIQSLPAAATAMRLPKHRHGSLDNDPPTGAAHQMHHHHRAPRPMPLSHSEASLPIRRPTPTTASLYASTLSPPGSRSMSPVGRVSSPAARPSSMAASMLGSLGGGAGPIIGIGGDVRGSRSNSVSTVNTVSTVTGAAPPIGAPFSRSLLESPAAESAGEPLSLLLKAFVPHVAVYSSRDTDELLREKGFSRGLCELLQPFGEQVQGRVMVRDSNGTTRPRDDFAVRFVPFGDNIETPQPVHGVVKASVTAPSLPLFGALRRGGSLRASAADGGGGDAAETPAAAARARMNSRSASNAAESRIPLVEAVVEQHLRFAEQSFLGGLQQPTTSMAKQQQQQQQQPQQTQQSQQQHDLELDAETTSPYYSLYLRRLLSGLPVACHETFAHPVACVIAISSRNSSPIQTFQELYRDISQGERQLPPWVDGDFLRYYVLVHDEERGDIVQSMALFEKMKRSLGLHCHLLRIRSIQSAETDDDSVLLPRSDWMTAAEEYADLERSERWEWDRKGEREEADGGEGEGKGEYGEYDDEDDYASPTRYIFESDAAAVRTFVRELVTQSIIPTMERSVSVWNDQVASKRRGLSGRFISLSKRWAGFGSSSSSSSSNGNSGSGGSRHGASGSGGGSSYNGQQGYYAAEASEAVMRKLADYAFMLRDWKLAMSTYDILRADFANDKAWKYHAAAHEMCGLALLILAPAASSRTKLETVDSMLEQAYYSYHTRCGNAYGALRSVTLGLELLRLRGGAAAVGDAVRWGMRLLEARLAGAVGDALLRERVAACCSARPAVGAGPLTAWGSWRRKAAFWHVLAAETWVAQGKYIQAQRCLNEARRAYSLLHCDDGIGGFALASGLMTGLQRRLKQGLAAGGRGPAGGAGGGAEPTEPAEQSGTGAEADASTPQADEEVQLMADARAEKMAKRRSRANSLLGGGGVQSALETAPLRSLAVAIEQGDPDLLDGGFGKV